MQAAEVIAFHLCWDVSDVREYRYKPTRYVTPAVYNLGGDFYFCSPTAKQKLPQDLGKWEKVATEYGRDIYRSDGQDEAPPSEAG